MMHQFSRTSTLLISFYGIIVLSISGRVRSNPVPITPECQKYCDSKRPHGTTKPFIADCGLKISHGTFKCAGACHDNKCPDYLCPKQFDVNCPSGISLKPAPSKNKQSKTLRSPAIFGYIAAILLTILIILGIISCFVRYYRKRKRRNLVEPDDENDRLPVVVSLNSSTRQVPTDN